MNWFAAQVARAHRLIKEFRTHRRDKRIARLGGMPHPEAQLVAEVFTPDLKEAHRLKLVEEHVRRIGPHGFDEATGDALDTMITRMGEELTAELRREYERFLARATERDELITAVVEQHRLLHVRDLERLWELDDVLEATLYCLHEEATRQDDEEATGGDDRDD